MRLSFSCYVSRLLTDSCTQQREGKKGVGGGFHCFLFACLVRLTVCLLIDSQVRCRLCGGSVMETHSSLTLQGFGFMCAGVPASCGLICSE